MKQVERRNLWATGLLCFCAGALYGWSALIGPVQSVFLVTTAQAGLIFSFAIMSFTTAIIVSPTAFSTYAPAQRLAIFGGAAALSVSAAMMADSYVLFVLAFSGGFGAMSGALYITALGVASNATSHAVATPVMVAAFGAGGAVFGPIWRLFDGWGLGLAGLWYLAIALGVASTLVALSGVGLKPSFNSSKTTQMWTVFKRNFGRRYVLIWLTFAFGSFAGLMVLGLASKMIDSSGIGIGLASISLAGIALANTLGRLSVAGLLRVFRIQHCLFLALCISAVGLAFLGTQIGLSFGLIFIAAGYGIIAASIPMITRLVFGPEAFQHLFATLMTAWGFAGFCAPWVSGAIFDHTGSFGGALLLAIVMVILCSLTAWRLSKHIS